MTANPSSPAGVAESLRSVVAAEHPYPAERFSGRGIVMCAGGTRMLTCAWVAINVLRRVVGCSLPVELWHIGPRELGALETAIFEPLDVLVVDALDVAKRWPLRNLGGWELKAYALVHSSFEEALLLDADNVAVEDPEILFESPQFVRTGAIAWPDLGRLSRENPIWELCGVRFREEPAWESGQLYVDKSRCWHALQIALHMNMYSESFYAHTHGDKDTFHLAWILAGSDWAMPGHPARRTSTALCQRDFDGRLVFQHRSIEKWRLTGKNLRAHGFRHEAQCLRFIDELRDRWSGTIDPLPPASAADEQLEQRMTSVRWFRLRHPDGRARLIELLEGNRIGIGSSHDRLLRWWARDGRVTIDGAHAVHPPLIARAGAGLSFVAVDGERPLELVPAPDAGLDTIGVTAAAVLERFSEDPAISEQDAVTALATLARIGDLADALLRAQSRWQGDDDVLRVIGRARGRCGMAGELVDDSLPGYEPLD